MEKLQLRDQLWGFAVQKAVAWPYIPMCLHMHANVKDRTTVFQYTAKKEDRNNAPPCCSTHFLLGANHEAVNIELQQRVWRSCVSKTFPK